MKSKSECGSKVSSIQVTFTSRYITKLQRVNTISAHLFMLFVFLEDDVSQFLWSPEQRKKLLGSVLSSLAASPNFHLETGALPHMEVEKDIELGRCARTSAVQSLSILMGKNYGSYSPC